MKFRDLFHPCRSLARAALAIPPLCLASCAFTVEAPLSRGDLHFVEEIAPVLESRCLPCHNGHTFLGGYDMSTRATAFQSGPAGPFIFPGKPQKSKILTVVLLAEEQHQAMPPTGHGLSEIEITLLEEWIRDGASWPEGRPGRLRPRRGAEPRSI